MSKKLYQYLGANVYRLRKQCRLTQSERLAKFNAIAIQQMRTSTGPGVIEIFVRKMIPALCKAIEHAAFSKNGKRRRVH